jgi:hypothetical protein
MRCTASCNRAASWLQVVAWHSTSNVWSMSFPRVESTGHERRPTGLSCERIKCSRPQPSKTDGAMLRTLE